MGFYVFVNIAFPCNNEDQIVQKVAAKHVERLKNAKEYRERVSLQFLEATASGKTINCAAKGEGCSYAVTGNYTLLDGLVEDLLPFFDDLWGADGPDGMSPIFDFEHVLVMVNPEQSGKMKVAEILSKYHKEDRDCNFRVGDPRVRSYEHDWSVHQC